jgi:hypothetical protein
VGAQHRLTAGAARRLLARGQRLTEPERSDGAPVAEVARHVVGIQAQERNAGALGVRARLAGAQASAVAAAVECGAITRLWCMRGTLHYVAREDSGWLVELLGPVTARRKRFADLGLDGDEPVRAVREVLADAPGPLMRHEIADAARARGLSFSDDPQAPVHLVVRAVLAGEVLEAGWRGGKPVYVLRGDREAPRERDVLLAELARRYLVAHAPAGPEDLAVWSGLPVSEARRAYGLLGTEVEPVEVLGRSAFVLRGTELDAGPAGVRLLPAWDGLLLCHRDRALTVGPDAPANAVAHGGILRPTLAVDGQVKAIWRLDRGKPAIEPFVPLAPDVEAAAQAEAADVVRFRRG